MIVLKELIVFFAKSVWNIKAKQKRNFQETFQIGIKPHSENTCKSNSGRKLPAS